MDTLYEKIEVERVVLKPQTDNWNDEITQFVNGSKGFFRPLCHSKRVSVCYVGLGTNEKFCSNSVGTVKY